MRNNNLNMNVNTYNLNLEIDWNALANSGKKVGQIKNGLDNWLFQNGFKKIEATVYTGKYEEKLFAVAFQLLKRTPLLKPYITKMTYEIQSEAGNDKDDLLAYYRKKYGDD